MTDDAPPPTRRAAHGAEAGRVCPYCRFALKQGAEVVECGACHAAHHTDCWEDNGGCAVMGCPGAPRAAAGAAAPASPPPPPRTPPPPPPPPPRTYAQPPPPNYPPPNAAPPPLASRGAAGWRTPSVFAGAVIVLALAITGGAVALVVSNNNQQSGANVPAPTVTVSPPPAPTPPAAPETPPPGAGILPNVDEATMEADITDLLRSHHQAIVAGNYYDAWVLTSRRYRAKKKRELGSFETWAEGQIDLGNNLDPGDVAASIRELDRRNGVATVDVSGMGWTKPGSPCSTWSGVTWARYENDHWRYEPGYSMSPQRRAEWFPRRTALLGWGC